MRFAPAEKTLVRAYRSCMTILMTLNLFPWTSEKNSRPNPYRENDGLRIAMFATVHHRRIHSDHYSLLCGSDVFICR